MQAVEAGAVDYDDIEPLCEACAEVADVAIDELKKEHKQRGEPGTDITPYWSGVVHILLRDMPKSLEGLLGEQLVRMGEAADYAENHLSETTA